MPGQPEEVKMQPYTRAKTIIGINSKKSYKLTVTQGSSRAPQKLSLSGCLLRQMLLSQSAPVVQRLVTK